MELASQNVQRQLAHKSNKKREKVLRCAALLGSRLTVLTSAVVTISFSCTLQIQERMWDMSRCRCKGGMWVRSCFMHNTSNKSPNPSRKRYRERKRTSSIISHGSRSEIDLSGRIQVKGRNNVGAWAVERGLKER